MWFAEKEIQIDHILPAGSLKDYKDLTRFLKRLTPESEKAYQILCKNCHQIKTNKERKKK